MINRFLTMRPRSKKRPEKPEDPQKNRLYDMERTIIGFCVDATVPYETLFAVCKHACRAWGIVPPDLRCIDDPERVFGGYWHQSGKLELNRSFHGANLGVLLHELAHHITWRKFGHDAEDHGPEFVAVYRWLLDRYNVIPEYAFDVILDRWGVDADLRLEVPEK